MNPVLILLIIIGAVIFWFLLSFIFYPFGKLIYKIYKNAIDKINCQEEQEKQNKDEKETK